VTRDEFARYCLEGSQWKPATLAAVNLAQTGYLPKGDIETFEREIAKPDGVVEVVRMAPLLFGFEGA
jgi:hypothetical protein